MLELLCQSQHLADIVLGESVGEKLKGKAFMPIQSTMTAITHFRILQLQGWARHACLHCLRIEAGIHSRQGLGETYLMLQRNRPSAKANNPPPHRISTGQFTMMDTDRPDLQYLQDLEVQLPFQPWPVKTLLPTVATLQTLLTRNFTAQLPHHPHHQTQTPQ